MKSSQMNFFVLPDDMGDIMEFLRKNNIVCVKQSSNNKNRIFCDNIDIKKYSSHIYYLTDKRFIKNISVDYIDSQNHYFVNDMTSYVIQFDIGGFYANKLNELNRGRLYFIKGYYDENKRFLDKDSEFVKWATDVLKKFKKTFLKHGKNILKDVWLSSKTIEWIKENNASELPSGLRFVTKS